MNKNKLPFWKAVHECRGAASPVINITQQGDHFQLLPVGSCSRMSCPIGYNLSSWIFMTPPWNYTPYLDVPTNKVIALDNATNIFDMYTCEKKTTSTLCCERVKCSYNNLGDSGFISVFGYSVKEMKRKFNKCILSDLDNFSASSWPTTAIEANAFCAKNWTCSCTTQAPECNLAEKPGCN